MRYRGVGCNGGQLISGGGSKLLEVVRQMGHQWTRKTDRFCIFLEVDVLFRHEICQRVCTTGFSCQNTRSQQISSLFLFYQRLENDLRGFWMTPYLENYVQRQTENSARECVLHLKVFEEITCLAFITLPPIINQRLCPWGSNPKTDHALQADSQ